MTAHKYIKNTGAVMRNALKVTFWKGEIHVENHLFKNKAAFAHATTTIAMQPEVSQMVRGVPHTREIT